MVNIKKLKGKMVENGVGMTELSEIMNVNRSTMYRKLGGHGENITCKDADIIAQALNLSSKEALEIFLANMSHKCDDEKECLK